MKMTVVRAATISTTNITGFFIILRGSSLAKAEPIAGHTIFGSVNEVTGIRLRKREVSIAATPRSEKLPGHHGELLDDWAKRERREEGETADDEDHADQQADEQTAMRGEGPRRRRQRLLGCERAGDS